mgnify:CR=1 FL=1
MSTVKPVPDVEGICDGAFTNAKPSDATGSLDSIGQVPAGKFEARHSSLGLPVPGGALPPPEVT